MAMHEQLTKNAAVLAMENENLKTEKEQALSKFSCLKSTNERLKDMLDKATTAEAMRDQSGDPDLVPINSPSSSTAPALFCGRPSLVPLFWPPFVHASDAFLSPVVPSLVSHADSEQVMDRLNEMANPVYLLPFPWFLPFQMQFITQASEPSIQYLQPGGIHNEAFMNALSSAGLSSRAEGHVEKSHASNTTKMDSEVPLLTTFATRDCGLGVASDGTGKQTAETMSCNATSNCGGASVSPRPSHTAQEPQQDDVVEMEAVSPSRWGLATKSEVPITCSSKKSASGAAAAEARKRRKELNKLKTMYYRNQRMR